MKKILVLAAVSALCGVAKANTIDVPSSLIGYETLNGNNAYAWNIDPNLTTGQQLTSATITFTGITLNVANSSGHGYLYTDLLNTTMTGTHGLTTATDNDAAGDYWATKYSGANIVSLGDEYFSSVGKTMSWSYNITGTELTDLNTYLAHGSFNIGIDPDCHFSVCDITFCYTVGQTGTPSVPDTATTGLLLGAGLLGVELARRKLAPAR